MNHFYETIKHLRTEEAILLHGKMVAPALSDEPEIISFLAEEFRIEQLDYPGLSPVFDEAAAIWGAKFVFMAAQLILHRDHDQDKLNGLMPPFIGKPTAASILSADLCLRFVPALVSELQNIDVNDPLIDLLTDTLQVWHYSGIPKIADATTLDLSAIIANTCVYQLYIDRVIEYKNKTLAEHPLVQKGIKESLGLYANLLMGV